MNPKYIFEYTCEINKTNELIQRYVKRGYEPISISSFVSASHNFVTILFKTNQKPSKCDDCPIDVEVRRNTRSCETCTKEHPAREMTTKKETQKA